MDPVEGPNDLIEEFSLTETEEFTFPESETPVIPETTSAFLAGFLRYYNSHQFCDMVILVPGGNPVDESVATLIHNYQPSESLSQVITTTDLALQTKPKFERSPSKDEELDLKGRSKSRKKRRKSKIKDLDKHPSPPLNEPSQNNRDSPRKRTQAKPTILTISDEDKPIDGPQQQNQPQHPNTEKLNPKISWVQFLKPDPTNVLPLVIEYMYKGDIDLTEKNCVAIMMIARQLQIPTLQKLAGVFFRTNLQRETVLDFLSQSVTCDVEDMKMMCINTIARNFSYLFNQNSPIQIYHKIEPREFLTIVCHENLQVTSEFLLYLTICNYTTTVQVDKEFADKLFSHVRFIWCTYDQLKVIASNKNIPPSLLVDALMFRLLPHEVSGAKQDKFDTVPEVREKLLPFLSKSSPTLLQPRPDLDVEIEYSPSRTEFFSGLLGWIATMYGTQKWQNPHTNGKVKVHPSTLSKGSRATFVDAVPAETWTNNVPSSWVSIDFGPHRRVSPNYYCLRHGTKFKADSLRNWELQGSVNDVEWTIICKHVNDESLNGSFHTAAFPIPQQPGTPAFRFLRIVQTGKNSSSHHFLALSGIECYGTLHVDNLVQ